MRRFVRHRLGLFVRIALWLFGLAAVLVVATPFVLLRRSTMRASACLARFHAARGPKLPDCSADIPALSNLARYPFLRHDATYRAEELWSRIMVAEYENACVGSPDPRLRHDTAKFVDDAETVVGRGSRRIQLDDLGPVVAAPHLGKTAASMGDRATLIEHFDWWGLWSVRKHAIDAALLEGDVPKAVDMAKRYYDWDPRDPDLRTAMGAVLCLGPDPGKGLELLTRVPGDRAEKRYAAIARNYGEVLAVMEACAKKAGVDVPAPPSTTHAGIADVALARLVEELRLVQAPALVHEAGDKAIALLQDPHGIDDDSPYARAMLLAALVAYDDRIGDEKGPVFVADLATPRDKDGVLSPPIRLLPRDLLDEPPGVVPMLSAEALVRAASKLEAIAARASTGGSAPSPAIPLHRASAALAIHAAIAASRAGDVDTALAQIDLSARTAKAPRRDVALGAASLAYVGGDAKRALDRLVGDEGDDAGVEAEIAFVSAVAHASQHDRAAAKADLARATRLAPKADDPRLALDLRWLDLALGEAPKGGGPLFAPVYTGMADPTARWEASGEAAIGANLEAWRRAFGASDADKRAFRYAVLRVRGDAPSFAVPYLVAGGRLLGEDGAAAGVEVWLDALSADDAPRMSMSAYAWSRLEAARMRGDEAASDAWKGRLSRIRAVKSEDADLEIARFLGL